MQQDVAAAERTDIHDRSDDVLTIRVKNESFESEKRSRDKTGISDLNFLVFVGKLGIWVSLLRSRSVLVGAVREDRFEDLFLRPDQVYQFRCVFTRQVIPICVVEHIKLVFLFHYFYF